MKATKKQRSWTEMTAEEIVAGTAAFVKAEASKQACGVPMRDREYWALLGQNFMNFFNVHQYGESAEYKWETRHVDGLCNLWIWHK